MGLGQSLEKMREDYQDKRNMLAALLLSALVLGIGMWHGLPNVYIPDTHIVRNALGMAKTMDFFPAVGTYSTYPYLLAYLLIPVYGITFFIGRALGIYLSADDFGLSVIENPTIVYIEARIMVGLFGVLGVWYLYRTARRLSFSPNTALFAALLLAFNPLYVQLGHQARPWIPLVAGLCFTLYHGVGIVQRARTRDYLWASVGAGLCFAIHQVGGAAFLIPLAAHGARLGKSFFSVKGLLRALFAGVIFAAVALFLGYGYMIFAGEAVDVMPTDKATLNFGGQKLVLDMFNGARAWITIKGLFGYDPVCFVLGILGLVLAIFHKGLTGARMILGVFGGFILAFFLIYQNCHIRYMLPLTPGLALGAAYLVDRLVARLKVKEVYVFVPLVLVGAIQCARMDYLLCLTDTRDIAQRWIELNIPRDARIAAEGYTAPLHPNVESLKYLKEEAGVWLRRKEKVVLEGKSRLVDVKRYYLIPLERFYGHKTYQPDSYRLGGEKPIKEFLDGNGIEWLMLYERWPRRGVAAPMVDYIQERCEQPPQIFNPASVDDPAEATLPTDMDFPLTTLWITKRPGPILKVYKVKK
jgi:hypothetical protein